MRDTPVKDSQRALRKNLRFASDLLRNFRAAASLKKKEQPRASLGRQCLARASSVSLSELSSPTAPQVPPEPVDEAPVDVTVETGRRAVTRAGSAQRMSQRTPETGGSTKRFTALICCSVLASGLRPPCRQRTCGVGWQQGEWVLSLPRYAQATRLYPIGVYTKRGRSRALSCECASTATSRALARPHLSVGRFHGGGERHGLEAEEEAVVKAEAVLSLALLLEPEVARHRRRLVVAAQQLHAAWERQLQREEVEHDLAAEAAAVHVVA